MYKFRLNNEKPINLLPVDVCRVNMMVLDYLSANLNLFKYDEKNLYAEVQNGKTAWKVYPKKLVVETVGQPVRTHTFKAKGLKDITIVHNGMNAEEENIDNMSVWKVFRSHEYVYSTIAIIFRDGTTEQLSLVFSKRFILYLLKIKEYYKVAKYVGKNTWKINIKPKEDKKEKGDKKSKKDEKAKQEKKERKAKKKAFKAWIKSLKNQNIANFKFAYGIDDYEVKILMAKKYVVLERAVLFNLPDPVEAPGITYNTQRQGGGENVNEGEILKKRLNNHKITKHLPIVGDIDNIKNDKSINNVKI
jgi:hypothetical protein